MFGDKKTYSLDDLLDAKPLDKTQPKNITKPIKHIKYSVDDLLEAEPVKSKPDYDRQIDQKITEIKAVETGLINNIKPVEPELYQAKQSSISPFINQPKIKDETFILQSKIDNYQKVKEKIAKNASQLGIDPQFAEQVSELSDDLFPVKDANPIRFSGGQQNEKYPVEDYFWGTVAAFNEGVAGVFKTMDNASMLINNALGIKTTKPTVFKELENLYKKGGSESGYIEPKGVLGEVFGGAAGMTADIMMASLFKSPELKLSKIKIPIPGFAQWLAAKMGIQTMYETNKPIKALTSASEGFITGLKYHMFGVVSKEIGLLAQESKLVEKIGTSKGVVSAVTGSLANMGLFGGDTFFSDPEVFNNGDINFKLGLKRAVPNMGIGLAFGAKDIGREVITATKFNQSIARKAWTAYFTSDRSTIQGGLQSVKTQRELRKQSITYFRNVIHSENPVEQNQYMLAKQAVDNIILTRPIAKMVAENPKKFKESIKNDKRLPEDVKKHWMDKIDETVEDVRNFQKVSETDGKVEKDYFVENEPTSRSNIERIVKQADAEQELNTIKIPEEDIALKMTIAEKRRLIRSDKKATVKEEEEKKLAEKKTEISEKQLPVKEEIPESEQKSETVKGITKVLYHGSPKQGIKKLSQNYAHGWGTGIYLTDNKQQALSEFGEGKNVYEVQVEIKNPADGNNMGKYENEITKTEVWEKETKKRREKTGDEELELDYYDELQENVELVNKALRELGYDGIVAKNSNNIQGNEYVVFNSDQIKQSEPKVETVKVEPLTEDSKIVKENIIKLSELNDKIGSTGGASKKNKLIKEKDELLNSNEKLKFIEGNKSEIIQQLKSKGLIELIGPCPV